MMRQQANRFGFVEGSRPDGLIVSRGRGLSLEALIYMRRPGRKESNRRILYGLSLLDDAAESS
jgi:hypothetical protein